MLDTLSQLPAIHIAFLALVVFVFTIYPVVLAFAYATTGRSEVSSRRRSAPAGAPAAQYGLTAATAG